MAGNIVDETGMESYDDLVLLLRQFVADITESLNFQSSKSDATQFVTSAGNICRIARSLEFAVPRENIFAKHRLEPMTSSLRHALKRMRLWSVEPGRKRLEKAIIESYMLQIERQITFFDGRAVARVETANPVCDLQTA